MTSATETFSTKEFLPALAIRVLTVLISGLVPILLVLLSVRVVLTDTYVRLIYQSPNFPADRYGWDESVRLEYGVYGVRYLLNDADISYLGELVIEGQPAFTQSELDHMEDVKVVTRGAMQVLWVSLGLFILATVGLLYSPTTRPAWLRAIQRGGRLTLSLVGLLLVLVVFSWDFFFDTFHALFFADGTWQFYLSDTLIRLYPQTFWFESSLVVGILTLGGAIGCWLLPRRWLPR